MSAPRVPLERATPEALDALARRVVLGEVFITNQPDGYRLAFGMILAFMREGESWLAWASQVGALYEELSKAAPRSANGYPMFFSARAVHLDDLDTLRALIDEKQARLAAL